MDVTYRRHRQASRLERLLGWRLRRETTTPPISARIDFVRAEAVDVTQA